MVLGSYIQTHREIQIGLGLTYQHRIAFIPLEIAPLIAAVVRRVKDGDDVAVALLGQPLGIIHRQGRVVDTIFLHMLAYAVVQHQGNRVDIRPRVMTRVSVAIGDRYGDDHRRGIRGDRHVNLILKAHL